MSTSISRLQKLSGIITEAIDMDNDQSFTVVLVDHNGRGFRKTEVTADSPAQALMQVVGGGLDTEDPESRLPYFERQLIQTESGWISTTDDYIILIW